MFQLGTILDFIDFTDPMLFEMQLQYKFKMDRKTGYIVSNYKNEHEPVCILIGYAAYMHLKFQVCFRSKAYCNGKTVTPHVYVRPLPSKALVIEEGPRSRWPGAT